MDEPSIEREAQPTLALFIDRLKSLPLGQGHHHCAVHDAPAGIEVFAATSSGRSDPQPG